MAYGGTIEEVRSKQRSQSKKRRHRQHVQGSKVRSLADMSQGQNGKGPELRKGHNHKKFSEGYEGIDWRTPEQRQQVINQIKGVGGGAVYDEANWFKDRCQCGGTCAGCSK